jgi:hypothetical protein
MLKIIAGRAGPPLAGPAARAAGWAAHAIFAARTALSGVAMILAPRPSVVRLPAVVPPRARIASPGRFIAPGPGIMRFRRWLALGKSGFDSWLRPVDAWSGIAMVRFGAVGGPGRCGGLAGGRHRRAQFRKQLS